MKYEKMFGNPKSTNLLTHSAKYENIILVLMRWALLFSSHTIIKTHKSILILYFKTSGKILLVGHFNNHPLLECLCMCVQGLFYMCVCVCVWVCVCSVCAVCVCVGGVCVLWGGWGECVCICVVCVWMREIGGFCDLWDNYLCRQC